MFCTQLGIRLSVPPLGRRKTSETNTKIKRQIYRDACERNAIEGRNGNARHRFGLDRLFSKLDETAKTEAALIILTMNASLRLVRWLTLFFRPLLSLFLYLFFSASPTYDSMEEVKEADKDLAEKLTEEGCVLLKNNGALSLKQDAKVTILGHSSTNILVCGTGSADINATLDVKEYPSALKSANGYLTMKAGVTDSFAQYPDAAIVAVSRLGGEMYALTASVDSQGDAEETVNGNALELTIQEKELMRHLKSEGKADRAPKSKRNDPVRAEGTPPARIFRRDRKTAEPAS